MKLNTKLLVAALAVASLSLPDVALANNGGISTMGDQLRTQIGSLTDLVGAVAFVIGLVFGASGLLKFKQHSENPQGTPLSHAMVRLLVAGSLIALPAILGTSVGTLFDSTPSQTTNGGGGNLTSITRR